MYHATGDGASGCHRQIGVTDRVNLHRCNARRFLDAAPLGIFMRMH
jgi:hypothetical protein